MWLHKKKTLLIYDMDADGVYAVTVASSIIRIIFM